MTKSKNDQLLVVQYLQSCEENYFSFLLLPLGFEEFLCQQQSVRQTGEKSFLPFFFFVTCVSKLTSCVSLLIRLLGFP